MSSEPQEVRSLYEAFVVAARRKDGKCPGLEKALAAASGDCPIMMFDKVEESISVCDKSNKGVQMAGLTTSQPFGVFKVWVSFVEEVKA